MNRDDYLSEFERMLVKMDTDLLTYENLYPDSDHAKVKRKTLNKLRTIWNLAIDDNMDVKFIIKAVRAFLKGVEDNITLPGYKVPKTMSKAKQEKLQHLLVELDKIPDDTYRSELLKP